VNVGFLDRLSKGRLVRNPSLAILEHQPRHFVVQSQLPCDRPVRRDGLAIVAQDRIVDVSEDLVPGIRLDMVRVDVDDKVFIPNCF